MSFTYADVDGSGDPSGAAAWMDTMATWPAVRAYKDRTIELLCDAAPVLDVGCGVGNDARAVGAIGVDPSLTMVTEARRRGGAFVRGDVLALSIASAAVGGVRTDRVLQHVDDVDGALAELARVLRVGGLMVLAEPDQTTLCIDGTDPDLTPEIVAFRRASIHHASLGGQLAGRLRSMGFAEVDRQAFTLEVVDPTLAFGLPSWPGMLVEQGTWSNDQAERFTSTLDHQSFRYSFDILVTWGRKGGVTPPR